MATENEPKLEWVWPLVAEWPRVAIGTQVLLFQKWLLPAESGQPVRIWRNDHKWSAEGRADLMSLSRWRSKGMVIYARMKQWIQLGLARAHIVSCERLSRNRQELAIQNCWWLPQTRANVSSRMGLQFPSDICRLKTIKSLRIYNVKEYSWLLNNKITIFKVQMKSNWVSIIANANIYLWRHLVDVIRIVLYKFLYVLYFLSQLNIIQWKI